MRIQTTNRLAHLQVELQETVEQNRCLYNQVQPKKNQISSMEYYLRTNNGDRKVMQQYKKACRELNTLCNRIRRNNDKIAKLQYRIQVESMKANTGYSSDFRSPRPRARMGYYY